MVEDRAVEVFEGFGIFGKDAGRAVRQWGIDEDGRSGHLLGVDERGEVEQQFLSPFECEDGNHEIAAASKRRFDFGAQQTPPVLDRQVIALAVTIGGLADDMIKACRALRVGMESLVLGTKVARAQKMDARDLQFDRSRTQNMSRIPEPGAKPWNRFEPLFEIDGLALSPGRKAVLLGVKRFERRLTGPIAAAVAPRSIAFLNASAIGEHKFEQIGCRRGAPDIAVEPIGDEPRQQAAVVDMGVRENNGVDIV